MLVSYTYLRHLKAGIFSRITWSVLLALLLSPFLLRAQHTKRPDYQLLWRIEAPGISTPSYLFGTMHLTEKRVFDFSDSVLLALRSTDAFAMEIDLDSVMAYMLSPSGPLRDTVNYMRKILTPAEYRFVDSLVMKKSGAPIAQLNLKRLWFVEKLLLDEDEVINKTAGTGAKAENIFLDGWLHQKATFMGKPVHSLERLENQLYFMSADVTTLQKEIFLESIGYQVVADDRPAEKELFDARVSFLDSLVNLYYAGDPQRMYNLVDKAKEDDMGPGLGKRNVEMAANLATLIKSKSVFAAVGAAHLSGNMGLITLLRAKGFSVNPVKATFTGVAQRERQRLDSVKGYTLNRMADGYSVVFPGVPIAYPIPNMNRKMYVGTNDNEAAFSLSMDLPQLDKNEKELVDMLIANMAAQGKAELKRSYPIVYRDIPGTEAVMMQGKLPFHMRLFIRNNRAFVFMYGSDGTDSIARKEFFKSVRFYDVVRAVSVYDTLYRPELGFSALMPADANYVKADHKGETRPVEAYTALDDANRISYVLRIEKMKPGYYNTDDAAALAGIRTVLIRQDSTLQLIDSTMTRKDGYAFFKLLYRHTSGYMSRLHFISRGNLAYSLLCTYDGKSKDSSYWRGFLDGFRLLPVKAQELNIPFTAADSSFTINGPERFTFYGHDKAVTVTDDVYAALDSASFSSYIVTINKFSRYHSGDPDSLMKAFLHPEDSSVLVTAYKKSVVDGWPVYDTELKSLNTSLRSYRRVIVVGHVMYCLSAIVPEEVVNAGRAQQFFDSFRPGEKEKASTLKIGDKKLAVLLADLQGTDTTAFKAASEYLVYMRPDSLDKTAILKALEAPFPLDTTGYKRVQLLVNLEDMADDTIVAATEHLFTTVKDTGLRIELLSFLSGLSLDTAMQTFIRLAAGIPEDNEINDNIFSYAMEDNGMQEKYLPDIIAAAEKSGGVLQQFVVHFNEDSIWRAPYFEKYGLERLAPGMVQLLGRQLKAWNTDQKENGGFVWLSRVLATGNTLSLPGMPVKAETVFPPLLTDSIPAISAFAARGLINHGIKVNDKVLKDILNDDAVGYSFIVDVESDQHLSKIQHLLTQELIGRAYLAYNMEEYNADVPIEQVSRIKVQIDNKPAVWITLYSYKSYDDELSYIFSGPQPLDPAKFNTKPDLFSPLEDVEKVKNKKELTAEAIRAYREYLAPPLAADEY